MTTQEIPTPLRVLAVMAHPDDIEFMAGGLMAQWARAGAELHYCLLTDGNSGSRDPNQTPMELATIRRREQQDAADLLHVSSVVFFGHPDGRLVNTIDLRLQIARRIRQVQPDAVLTSDPAMMYTPFYVNHPDHRAAGDTTLAAVMPLANTRLAALELLEEGLEPHDVSHVLLATPAKATHWVALSNEDRATQFKAMQAHKSQMGGWDVAKMFDERGRATAEEARAHGVDAEFAEGYVYIALRRPATTTDSATNEDKRKDLSPV